MFSIIAKLTAIKRWSSLPPIVWIGLTMVLGSWQSLALAETDCNTVTGISKEQCGALITLYDSTEGENWTDKTGWKQTDTPCSWFGITCSESEVEVVAIELNGNKLNGTIPNLSTLTQLTTLSLANNQLTGPIPSLSSLTQLQNLSLGQNQLTGKIPKLTTLTQIQNLNLANNQLKGPIPNLLASWAEFDISGNGSLCKDSEADYAGRTEVDAFPVCPDVILSAEINALEVCVGNEFTITVKKELSNRVDVIQFVMTYDPDFFRIERLTGEGAFGHETPQIDTDTNSIKFTASDGEIEGEFDIATIKLMPLASSAGSKLEFNREGLTYIRLNKVDLQHELRDVSVPIESVCTASGPTPSKNSPIQTLVGETELNKPNSVILDDEGNVYFSTARYVKKRDSQGNITVIAGNGKIDVTADNVQATETSLNNPQGLALDKEGNLYIADTRNHRIRKVDSNGIITTVVGTGEAGRSEEGDLATAALLNRPTAITFDTNGHFYIADTGNNRVCKINRNINANSTMTTFAGGGSSGKRGDGFLATEVTLNRPEGLVFDSQNNLYIADTGNYQVRKVNLYNEIATVAGIDGENGYSGDGGKATQAEFKKPMGLAIDSMNNLYIADQDNHRIRMVNYADGVISTFSGTGQSGHATDGILTAVAQLNQPTDVIIDKDGNLYIVEYGNNLIRKVNSESEHFCKTSEDIPPEECYALVALYDGTRGPEWSKNDGWSTVVDTPTSPCTWEGVTCSEGEDKHVIKIELSNNNLVGNLPTYIGDFDNLQELDLSQNDIGGNIPTVIGELRVLTHLNLSDNNLIGSLPEEIADAVQLQTLNLADNRLSGNIPALHSLTLLESLDLRNNYFNGAVPDLAGLTYLEIIHLTGMTQLCLGENSSSVPGITEPCPSEALLPIANFSATPIDYPQGVGKAPTTFQLNGWLSDPRFGQIDEFLWKTSDGQKLEGDMPTVTFVNSGLYEISLQVVNTDGSPSANTAKKLIRLEVAANARILQFDKAGMGIGVVSARRDQDAAARCGTRCPGKSLDYPVDSVIKLKARAALGSVFNGWSGDNCVGVPDDAESERTLTMDAHKECIAQFDLADTPPEGMSELTVSAIGIDEGDGKVSVRGILCEEPLCRGYYPQEMLIRITAISKPHAYFTKWNTTCPFLGSEEDAKNLVVLTPRTPKAKCIAHFDTDSKPAAEETAKEFEQVGVLLGTDTKVTENYSEENNRERYEQAFRFAEKAMMTVEEQLRLNGTWPVKFKDLENWFDPMPENLYVEKIQIKSDETVYDDGASVNGNHINIEVSLLNKDGEEELVSILVYYDDKEPTIEFTQIENTEQANLRRGHWRPRRPRLSFRRFFRRFFR